MNLTRSSLTLVCFGLLSVSAMSAARAEFKCDQPKLARVDAIACAKAAESSTALRQFVSRTQRIYGLQMSDYARFVGDEPKPAAVQAAVATPSPTVAGLTVTPR